jgi:hypothetical protein
MPGATGRFKLDSHYNTWGKTIYIGPPEPTLVTQQ